MLRVFSLENHVGVSVYLVTTRMKGISALWEKELHLGDRRRQLLTQEVSIYGISVKKRIDIVVFVRMNLYISEAKEARTTKFCENVSY